MASTAARRIVRLQIIHRWLEIAGWACAALWLLLAAFSWGGQGFNALAFTGFHMLLLIVITTLTRTLPLKSLFGTFMLGALLMYVARFLFAGLDLIGITYGSFLRSFIAPLVEQSLIVLPVAAFLYMGRGAAARVVGASDLALMAAACGCGFGLISSINVVHTWGVDHFGVVAFYPAYLGGGSHACAGYAVWAQLYGAALGLAALFRFKPKWTKVVSLVAFGWVLIDQFIDHFDACNMYGREGNALCGTLHWLYGGGFITPWLSLVVLVLAVLFDLTIVSKFSVVNFPQQQSPLGLLMKARGSFTELMKRWDYVLWARRLAYVDFRSRYADETFKEHARNFKELVLKVLADSPQRWAAETASSKLPTKEGGAKEARTEEVKTEAAKTEDAKIQDVKTEDIKTEAVETGAAKTEAKKTEEVKTEAAKNVSTPDVTP